jgi:hypothetical protein
MGWWFGRKAAEPERPFVPVWLQGDGEAGGFVRGIEGARVFDRVSGQTVVRRNGGWEAGIVRAEEVRIDDLTVVRQRQPAIADPDGGSVVDSQCRDAVAAILSAMRNHGLIA